MPPSTAFIVFRPPANFDQLQTLHLRGKFSGYSLNPYTPRECRADLATSIVKEFANVYFAKSANMSDGYVLKADVSEKVGITDVNAATAASAVTSTTSPITKPEDTPKTQSVESPVVASPGK